MAASITIGAVDSSTPQILPYLDPAYGNTVLVRNVGLETVYFASIDTRASAANRLVTAGYPLFPGDSVTFPASLEADFHQTGFNTLAGTSEITYVCAVPSSQSS